MSFTKKLYKLFHWEFWPVYMFYIPNSFYVLYRVWKERSFTFFTLTNPGIDNSGIGTESKFKTLQIIPKKYLPKTLYHNANTSIKKTIKCLQKDGFTYPIIVKPDIGFRGLLVKKINSEKEFISYINNKPVNFIIQQFIDLPNECGVFFIRHPKESIGKITSITLKKCPTVIGNGRNTILELIQKDKHLSLFKDQIEFLSNIDINIVPKKGKTLQITSIGNHSKGTKFISGNDLINKKLINTFNELNKEIKGWFYGRVDIKYDSWEDVENGKFKIIELNGILGEPTHIYDTSKMNYFKALKIMRLHWKDLYAIATYNHKTGIPYKGRKEFFRELKELKRYTKQVKSLSK